ncbi:MAG: hypothetical protein HY669_04340, partial [Chloroflexi bacterium]|nr:hypothetical protein [Chloroflexota bacterium]
MIAAGIDMGARTVKAVVIDDGRILSHSIVSAGWELLESAQKALEEAAEKAGISRHSIERITVTGIGRKAVTFATSFATESTCDAKGINLVAPSVRTVIDIGAEESRGIRCDASGKVLDFAKNDKCAAGVGSFVESMARALEVK